MPRTYTHIKQYEKEIFELKAKGLTNREIAERLGFKLDQVKDLISRHNKNQRKLEAGIVLKKKGRPPKTDKYDIETAKLNELKYIIARKDAKIRALQMENDLMRDFLSQTERK